MKKRLLIIDDNVMLLALIKHCYSETFDLTLCNSLHEAKDILQSGLMPDGIITDLNLEDGDGKAIISYLKTNPLYVNIPLIVLSGEDKSQSRIECLKLGADDYVVKPFHPEELQIRIEKLLNVLPSSNNSNNANTADKKDSDDKPSKGFLTPKLSFRKRFFDIVVAGTALLLLSPLLLIVAILIKLDSKGPVFFLSKRIGAGYKVFELYKFRTMRTGAENEIKNMAHLNMYETAKQEVDLASDGNLIDDSGWKNEEVILDENSQKSAFLKFKDDPRITKLGAFLRNTSIDEIPQLINIIKGDMSIVGNRPLPLYEAEQLTKDESIARFLAPAGLTGLWQVTKRGKGELSAKERQDLDNTYAQKHNWKFDLKLIAKTFPALFQSEKM
ncbi:response regulator receiver protein [Emticicia oligotrophica DSM 17448]|uniref:Response regulator receiver protein n=1 Tax=Emticicia oligotrophica (strain DSM 17448 / CIP 109782 / MTCC 6937 / GPTSA100-15) TaxID=929562 RepID=A0ABM5N5Z9_EMTOG|nr:MULTISPECIES: sugar transferase [Emticicia]AFK04960.1 response regulator receiver protein [Emticicia oligotrophica DSM 17448]